MKFRWNLSKVKRLYYLPYPFSIHFLKILAILDVVKHHDTVVLLLRTEIRNKISATFTAWLISEGLLPYRFYGEQHQDGGGDLEACL